MLNDLKKSFDQIIYERTTSPFYGSVIISWLIWNWKIVYLTFFISQDKIELNKIDYIIKNFSDTNHAIIYPLISAFILVSFMPFITNGAYWLSLKFNKWKVDQKNLVDKKQLLSIEQSIELREQIAKQEERFAKLVEDKNIEIKQLTLKLEEYREKAASDVTLETILSNNNGYIDTSDELLGLVNRLKNNPKEFEEYEIIIDCIQRGNKPIDRSDVSNRFVSLLESYGIINRLPNGNYSQTEIGKKFYRLLNQ